MTKELDSCLDNDLVDTLLTEAKSWMNTKWEHQGKIKGKGVDCVHYVDACLINAIGSKFDIKIQIPHNYNPKEDGTLMLRLLSDLLEYIPIEERKRGDIIAFIDLDCKNVDSPSHLAFIDNVSPQTTYIFEAGRTGVVRHRLDGHWMKRIHSVWRVSLDKLKEFQGRELSLAK